MRDSTVPLFVALLAVASVVVAVPAGVAGADVAVRSANTSVDQPAPGEPFILRVEVANFESSAGPVEVKDVIVRRTDGTREYARIEDAGTLPAGDAVEIPLAVRIDEPGEVRLTVAVVVQNEAGEFRCVSYPLFLDVQEPDEAVLSFTDLGSVAGEENAVNVTVSNGDTAPLSNVRLELDGAADIENPDRVMASLAAGTQRTHSFRATFPEPGERSLDATLTYTTSSGSTRSVDREVTAEVEPADVDTELTAEPTQRNGSAVVRATLTEFGNVQLRDVQLRAVVGGETVARTQLPDVAAEGSRTAILNGGAIPTGEVRIVARYTAAGENRQSSTLLRYAPQAASAIALTSVEATRQGSRVTLSGDAANTGGLDADAVLVSVADRTGVQPASPNGEYFVGSVEASEFATFELTANASAAAGSVPVRVNYSADGEQFSRVVEVDVSGATMALPGGAGGPDGDRTIGGGLPLLPLGVGLAALLAVLAYVWRKR